MIGTAAQVLSIIRTAFDGQHDIEMHTADDGKILYDGRYPEESILFGTDRQCLADGIIGAKIFVSGGFADDDAVEIREGIGWVTAQQGEAESGKEAIIDIGDLLVIFEKVLLTDADNRPPGLGHSHDILYFGKVLFEVDGQYDRRNEYIFFFCAAGKGGKESTVRGGIGAFRWAGHLYPIEAGAIRMEGIDVGLMANK